MNVTPCDWTNLGHGFHETEHGVRDTLSEPARPTKILARLLKLNHERCAEEVKQGLHEKKKGGAGRVKRGAKKAKSKSDNNLTLFDTLHPTRSTPHDGSGDA